MKTYKIINSDIMLKGKLFPEGSMIELDDDTVKTLSSYLEIVNDSGPVEVIQKIKNKRSTKK